MCVCRKQVLSSNVFSDGIGLKSALSQFVLKSWCWCINIADIWFFLRTKRIRPSLFCGVWFAGVDALFSVGLASTPLCQVPDALAYIAEYLYMEGAKEQDPVTEAGDSTPQPELASKSSTRDVSFTSTTTRPWTTDSTKNPMEGVPPNPCTWVLAILNLKLSCLCNVVSVDGVHNKKNFHMDRGGKPRDFSSCKTELVLALELAVRLVLQVLVVLHWWW